MNKVTGSVQVLWNGLQWQAILLLCIFTVGTAVADSRGITMETVKQTTDKDFMQGTYRALIIGNNQYTDPEGRWMPLKTALPDARAVKDVLQKQYGFTDIQFLENATRRDVLIALSNLSRRVLSNDNVLVYYAGHGYLDEETNKGFWVPVDARGTDQTTFLRNSTIRDEMSLIASRSKHTLLISDSCFSGSLLRSGTRSIKPDTNNELYYRKVANKRSVQIMSAGGVEYVDDSYRTSGHSPFTYFLLNELKNNDRKLITVSELSTNVEKAVANNVDQVPESGVLQGAGDELGEFIFIKLDVEVVGIPKENVKVQVNIIPKKNSGTSKNIKKAPVKQQERVVAPMPTL
jgi:hypothetical protein